MIIAAVLWQDYTGSYHPFHVKRLRDQALPYVPVATRFVCLTNASHWEDADREGWDIVPMRDGPIHPRLKRPHGNRGWWSKIELFRPDLFDERVLYLDLDVEIVGDLEPLMKFDSPFAAVDDYENRRREKGRRQINSSVMVFDPGAGSACYTPDPPMEDYFGDQAWISDRIPDIARFPPSWCVSWKWQVAKFGCPHDAKVVVYHGKPRPWEPEARARRRQMEIGGMFPKERRLTGAGVVELVAGEVEPHDFRRYRERMHIHPG